MGRSSEVLCDQREWRNHEFEWCLSELDLPSQHTLCLREQCYFRDELPRLLAQLSELDGGLHTPSAKTLP